MVYVIVGEAWRKFLEWLGLAPKTETVQQFTYPGWDQLLKDLEVKTPEQMLEEQSTALRASFDEAVAPHSPITPEEARDKATMFGLAANMAYGNLIGLATAVETLGFGQLETPAFMLPHAPIVRGVIEAAESSMRVLFDASMNTSLRYFMLKAHQPMIIPESVLLDAVRMDIISEELYTAQMMYHGYTPERSAVMARTNIRMPDVGTIIEMRRRGFLSDAGAVDWMVKTRIPRESAQAIVALYREVPEPYRTADFAAKGLISEKAIGDAFEFHGIDRSWAPIWKASQASFPSFETGLNLLWRGVINADTLKSWMLRAAVPTEVTEKMLVLSEQLPPMSDLVTMVVREAFDPAYVVEAPGVFAAEMAKKGFAKVWSDRYWTAHFLPMAIQYGYANLHRGYWTREQFLELLRIADIHPKWREDIYNVAFNPPSIREMGYGYDVGAYTLEDIVRYRRWGGLSEEDAKKAGQAMVAYRTEAEREAVRREYLQLYVLGRISREEFAEELAGIGTAKEAIPLWLERGDLLIERKDAETSIVEPRTLTRSDAQWLFEHGVRDEAWMRLVLSGLGYSEANIDAYVAQSKKRMEERIKPEKIPTVRELTLAQLRSLYYAELIDIGELRARILGLEYSAEDTETLIRIIEAEKPKPKEPRALTRSEWVDLYALDLITLADADVLAILAARIKTEKRPSKTEALVKAFSALGYEVRVAARFALSTIVSTVLSDLRSRYSKGWISAAGIYEEMLSLGVPKERAAEIMQTIIKAEQPARVQVERDLTKAEIIKGVKGGVLVPTQGVELLMSIGYDANEAWYLLAISGVVAAGDPQGYWEMRKVTEAYKKARGEPFKEIPEEIITLERRLREQKAELERLKAAHASEKEIGDVAVTIATIQNAMRTIIAKLKL